MEAPIIKIGNSKGIILPKRLINKFGSVQKVNVKPMDKGLYIEPVENEHRKNWEKKFSDAIKAGQEPENDFFEGINNHFDQEEWTW